MPRREVGVMAPESRRRLLRTAAHEFAGVGYERASLNTIIRSCRMSKSSFYHYFASKATLFDAVVREAAASLSQELAVPPVTELDGPDFWERVAQFCYRLLALAERETWYADVGRLFYLPDAPTSRSPALREVTTGILDWVQRALDVGRASGAVRADLPRSLQVELAVGVLQILDRWSLHHMNEIAENRALARAQLDVLRRLLEPAPPGQQRT